MSDRKYEFDVKFKLDDAVFQRQLKQTDKAVDRLAKGARVLSVIADSFRDLGGQAAAMIDKVNKNVDKVASTALDKVVRLESRVDQLERELKAVKQMSSGLGVGSFSMHDMGNKGEQRRLARHIGISTHDVSDAKLQKQLQQAFGIKGSNLTGKADISSTQATKAMLRSAIAAPIVSAINRLKVSNQNSSAASDVTSATSIPATNDQKVRTRPSQIALNSRQGDFAFSTYGQDALINHYAENSKASKSTVKDGLAKKWMQHELGMSADTADIVRRQFIAYKDPRNKSNKAYSGDQRNSMMLMGVVTEPLKQKLDVLHQDLRDVNHSILYGKHRRNNKGQVVDNIELDEKGRSKAFTQADLRDNVRASTSLLNQMKGFLSRFESGAISAPGAPFVGQHGNAISIGGGQNLSHRAINALGINDPEIAAASRDPKKFIEKKVSAAIPSKEGYDKSRRDDVVKHISSQLLTAYSKNEMSLERLLMTVGNMGKHNNISEVLDKYAEPSEAAKGKSSRKNGDVIAISDPEEIARTVIHQAGIVPTNIMAQSISAVQRRGLSGDNLIQAISDRNSYEAKNWQTADGAYLTRQYNMPAKMLGLFNPYYDGEKELVDGKKPKRAATRTENREMHKVLETFDDYKTGVGQVAAQIQDEMRNSNKAEAASWQKLGDLWATLEGKGPNKLQDRIGKFVRGSTELEGLDSDFKTGLQSNILRLLESAFDVKAPDDVSDKKRMGLINDVLNERRITYAKVSQEGFSGKGLSDKEKKEIADSRTTYKSQAKQRLDAMGINYDNDRVMKEAFSDFLHDKVGDLHAGGVLPDDNRALSRLAASKVEAMSSFFPKDAALSGRKLQDSFIAAAKSVQGVSFEEIAGSVAGVSGKPEKGVLGLGDLEKLSSKQVSILESMDKSVSTIAARLLRARGGKSSDVGGRGSQKLKDVQIMEMTIGGMVPPNVGGRNASGPIMVAPGGGSGGASGGGSEGSLVDGFTDRLGRVAAWGSSGMTFYGAVSGIKSSMGVMSDFDEVLTQIRQVANPLDTDMKKLSRSTRDLAKDLGANLGEAGESMLIYAQQGRSITEMINLATTAMVGQNVTILNLVEATESLTAAQKQFKMPTMDSMKILDSWNSVANTTSVNARVLAESTKNAGTVARLAGIDFDMFTGITAAIGEATRKSGEAIGTSLKYILQHVREEKAVKALSQVGVAVQDVEGNFRSTRGIIDELEGKWDKLSESQRQHVAVSIAGTRRLNDFFVMVENWDRGKDIARTSSLSSGSALRENETALQSFSRKVAITKAAWDDLVVTVGDNGALDAGKWVANTATRGLTAVTGGIDKAFNGSGTERALYGGALTAGAAGGLYLGAKGLISMLPASMGGGSKNVDVDAKKSFLGRLGKGAAGATFANLAGGYLADSTGYEERERRGDQKTVGDAAIDTATYAANAFSFASIADGMKGGPKKMAIKGAIGLAALMSSIGSWFEALSDEVPAEQLKKDVDHATNQITQISNIENRLREHAKGGANSQIDPSELSQLYNKASVILGKSSRSVRQYSAKDLARQLREAIDERTDKIFADKVGIVLERIKSGVDSDPYLERERLNSQQAEYYAQNGNRFDLDIETRLQEVDNVISDMERGVTGLAKQAASSGNDLKQVMNLIDGFGGDMHDQDRKNLVSKVVDSWISELSEGATPEEIKKHVGLRGERFANSMTAQDVKDASVAVRKQYRTPMDVDSLPKLTSQIARLISSMESNYNRALQRQDIMSAARDVGSGSLPSRRGDGRWTSTSMMAEVSSKIDMLDNPGTPIEMPDHKNVSVVMHSLIGQLSKAEMDKGNLNLASAVNMKNVLSGLTPHIEGEVGNAISWMLKNGVDNEKATPHENRLKSIIRDSGKIENLKGMIRDVSTLRERGEFSKAFDLEKVLRSNASSYASTSIDRSMKMLGEVVDQRVLSVIQDPTVFAGQMSKSLFTKNVAFGTSIDEFEKGQEFKSVQALMRKNLQNLAVAIGDTRRSLFDPKVTSEGQKRLGDELKYLTSIFTSLSHATKNFGSLVQSQVDMLKSDQEIAKFNAMFDSQRSFGMTESFVADQQAKTIASMLKPIADKFDKGIQLTPAEGEKFKALQGILVNLKTQKVIRDVRRDQVFGGHHMALAGYGMASMGHPSGFPDALIQQLSATHQEHFLKMLQAAEPSMRGMSADQRMAFVDDQIKPVLSNLTSTIDELRNSRDFQFQKQYMLATPSQQVLVDRIKEMQSQGINIQDIMADPNLKMAAKSNPMLSSLMDHSLEVESSKKALKLLVEGLGGTTSAAGDLSKNLDQLNKDVVNFASRFGVPQPQKVVEPGSIRGPIPLMSTGSIGHKSSIVDSEGKIKGTNRVEVHDGEIILNKKQAEQYLNVPKFETGTIPGGGMFSNDSARYRELSGMDQSDSPKSLPEYNESKKTFARSIDQVLRRAARKAAKDNPFGVDEKSMLSHLADSGKLDAMAENMSKSNKYAFESKLQKRGRSANGSSYGFYDPKDKKVVPIRIPNERPIEHTTTFFKHEYAHALMDGLKMSSENPTSHPDKLSDTHLKLYRQLFQMSLDPKDSSFEAARNYMASVPKYSDIIDKIRGGEAISRGEFVRVTEELLAYRMGIEGKKSKKTAKGSELPRGSRDLLRFFEDHSEGMVANLDEYWSTGKASNSIDINAIVDSLERQGYTGRITSSMIDDGYKTWFEVDSERASKTFAEIQRYKYSRERKNETRSWHSDVPGRNKVEHAFDKAVSRIPSMVEDGSKERYLSVKSRIADIPRRIAEIRGEIEEIEGRNSKVSMLLQDDMLLDNLDGSNISNDLDLDVKAKIHSNQIDALLEDGRRERINRRLQKKTRKGKGRVRALQSESKVLQEELSRHIWSTKEVLQGERASLTPPIVKMMDMGDTVKVSAGGSSKPSALQPDNAGGMPAADREAFRKSPINAIQNQIRALEESIKIDRERLNNPGSEDAKLNRRRQKKYLKRMEANSRKLKALMDEKNKLSAANTPKVAPVTPASVSSVDAGISSKRRRTTNKPAVTPLASLAVDDAPKRWVGKIVERLNETVVSADKFGSVAMGAFGLEMLEMAVGGIANKLGYGEAYDKGFGDYYDKNIEKGLTSIGMIDMATAMRSGSLGIADTVAGVGRFLGSKSKMLSSAGTAIGTTAKKVAPGIINSLAAAGSSTGWYTRGLSSAGKFVAPVALVDGAMVASEYLANPVWSGVANIQESMGMDKSAKKSRALAEHGGMMLSNVRDAVWRGVPALFGNNTDTTDYNALLDQMDADGHSKSGFVQDVRTMLAAKDLVEVIKARKNEMAINVERGNKSNSLHGPIVSHVSDATFGTFENMYLRKRVRSLAELAAPGSHLVGTNSTSEAVSPYDYIKSLRDDVASKIETLNKQIIRLEGLKETDAYRPQAGKAKIDGGIKSRKSMIQAWSDAVAGYDDVLTGNSQSVSAVMLARMIREKTELNEEWVSNRQRYAKAGISPGDTPFTEMMREGLNNSFRNVFGAYPDAYGEEFSRSIFEKALSMGEAVSLEDVLSKQGFDTSQIDKKIKLEAQLKMLGADPSTPGQDESAEIKALRNGIAATMTNANRHGGGPVVLNGTTRFNEGHMDEYIIPGHAAKKFHDGVNKLQRLTEATQSNKLLSEFAQGFNLQAPKQGKPDKTLGSGVRNSIGDIGGSLAFGLQAPKEGLPSGLGGSGVRRSLDEDVVRPSIALAKYDTMAADAKQFTESQGLSTSQESKMDVRGEITLGASDEIRELLGDLREVVDLLKEQDGLGGVDITSRIPSVFG